MPLNSISSKPFIFFCRPGFESDCAAEIQELAASCELAGYAKAKPGVGHIQFLLFDPDSEKQFYDELFLDELIFSRQWFWAQSELEELPLDNRVKPILEAIAGFGGGYRVLVEHFDSEQGRELSKFCKKISTPLTIALEKSDLIKENSNEQLHIVFITNQHCLVGISPKDRASKEKGGILRLKSGKGAPSRSSLKLDEAIQVLVSGKQRKSLFRLGHTAVDLGAAPGGWTFQLLQRELQVIAIDNGPMDKSLMVNEQVTHLRENALTWMPNKPVNLVVCDMVEKPSLVAKLMSKWLLNGKADYAIFNLKLPMKKRFQEVSDCIGLICNELEQADLKYDWQAKHLYHDREEITVYIKVKRQKLH